MKHNEGYRRARGKAYRTCVVALARKFLRFLFAFYWKKTVTLPNRKQVLTLALSTVSSISGIAAS